ncbi:hypothetical protein BH18THE2_BH18THE2_41440 [soil metagenome]
MHSVKRGVSLYYMHRPYQINKRLKFGNVGVEYLSLLSKLNYDFAELIITTINRQ